jgi:spore coat protein CotH
VNNGGGASDDKGNGDSSGNENNPGSGNEDNPGSGNQDNPGSGNQDNPGSGEDVSTPDDPDEELALFYDFFDQKNHISIKLDISNSELKKIQKDYEKYSSMGSKSPIYRMADMIVTITKPDGSAKRYTVEQVGVRMKGNTSRTSFYSDNDGMYNLIHFKISFGETFDEEEYYGSSALVWENDEAREARKDRTFATLEKIDIRWNRNDDTTYIRESYAYDLYREHGVLAPHTNLASVDIGNDHAGVWVVYEPIDKIFLEKNLPEDALGGDLYKLGWTSEGATFTSFSSYGVEDEDKCQFFVYDLKTNKKKSTHQSLKNLISTLNSSNLSKEKFASVVDVENFMYYAAVSYMVGNCDDLRNNYNNSYVYFRGDTGQMMVIPYDMDRGLGINVWNPTGHGMTKEDPFNKKALGNNSDQRSPLFLKSVCQGGFFVNEYTEALKEVDGSEMLTNAYFTECFNLAKELYSADVTPSKTYNNASGHKFRFDINRTCSAGDSKNMSFSDYISAKRETLYKSIGDQGNTDDSGNGGNVTVTEWDLYLRGNFDDNNWESHSKYKLNHIGNGIYAVTVSPSGSSGDAGTFKFKIYNERQSGDEAWYNTVDESKINAPFEYQGGNRNVQLALGTYTIYFDTNTMKVYFEKK